MFRTAGQIPSATSDPPLRVGIIGAGWAARHLHVPAIRRARCGIIVAVSDPRENARRAIAARGYADWRALLHDDACDAVIIATPPDSHAEVAIAALDAGLHVLLEKPLATSVRDGERIAAAARASGRVVALGFNQRGHPALARLRARAMAHGAITSIHIAWSTSSGLTARDWLGVRERGGGVLFDLGSHAVDLWRFLGDDDIASLRAELHPGPIDDAAAQLTGTLRNGVMVTAELSLVGRDAFAVTVGSGGRTTTVRPYRRGMAESYARQWRAFAAAVHGKGAVAATVDDGLAALACIETLTRSATVQRPAAVPVPATEFPLTLIVATSRDYAAIRTTVAHFARQTIAARAELILVGPSEPALACPTEDVARFGAVVRVAVGPVASIGHAIAAGVRRARGRVVALAEDHCFPDPEWAETLLRTHEGDCSVVGPVVRNANPRSAVSEADFVMGYGPWMDPTPKREMPFLPGHNSSYKRDELLALGDRLPSLLESETVLHMQWAAEGRKLVVEPGARMRHVNFSLWRSWIPVTFLAGRVFGGYRASPWPWRRRLLYAGASPLIPAVRLVRIVREFVRPGRSLRRLLWMAPTLLTGLIVDAAGQCIGYLAGPGDAMRGLARYEYNRRDHVRAEERALWISP